MRAKAAASTLILVLLAGTASAEPAGFVAAVRGMAEMRSGGTRMFTLAAIDRDVSEGDTLRTARNAWMKVLLRDDTILALDEETELLLDRFALGSLAAQQPNRLELLSGHLRTKVGEVFGGYTRIEIHTPTAVIGVKGTEWITWIEEKATFVCVIAGLVTAASNNAAIGGELELGAGQCARIGRDLAPGRIENPGLPPVSMQRASSQGRPDEPHLALDTDPLVIEANDIPLRIELPDPEPPVRRPEPEPPPPAPQDQDLIPLP